MLYRIVRPAGGSGCIRVQGRKDDIALLSKFRTVQGRGECRDVGFAAEGAADGGAVERFGGASVSASRLRNGGLADHATSEALDEEAAFALPAFTRKGTQLVPLFLVYKSDAAAWKVGGDAPWRVHDDATRDDPDHKLLVPDSSRASETMDDLESARSRALADSLHLWQYDGVVFRLPAAEPYKEADDGSIDSVGVLALALKHVENYELNAEVVFRACGVRDALAKDRDVTALSPYERALAVHALLSLEDSPGCCETLGDIAREIAGEMALAFDGLETGTVQIA